MTYRSTRGESPLVTAEQALLQGLAPDGGLYIPQSFPEIDSPETLAGLTYDELLGHILAPFFRYISRAELISAARAAYADFSHQPPAVLRSGLSHDWLELYHGPTLSFKDMALRLLPHLMRLAKAHLELDHKTLLVTATSGDTGIAAMSGFSDIPGFQVIVFYPKDGVSPLQERQMLAHQAANTTAIALEGNFDDAQRGVKALLSNKDLTDWLGQRGWVGASANSINLGRLLAQIVYYAYVSLRFDQPVRFCVPTGNFGNVLASHWARRLGFAIDQLTVAANDNHVLDDFFKTGRYLADRPLITTESPSMDILISSNLERLLAEQPADQVRRAMTDLAQSKQFSWPKQWPGFTSGYATQAEAAREIRRVWQSEGYLIDPHTAVASAVFGRSRQSGVVVSTASPFKFPDFVLQSLGQTPGADPLESLTKLSQLTKLAIPEPLEKLTRANIPPPQVCRVDQMEARLREVIDV